MNTKRSLATALMLAILCFALGGCLGPTDSATSAVYPDDKLVVQRGDTYSAKLWDGSLPGKVVMDGFTGTASLLRISVPEGGGELFVDWDQEVGAGSFKTVLVKYGESVELVCEGTDSGERAFSLEAGDYAVKAVGLDASSHISAQIKASKGVEAVLPGDALDEDEPVVLEPLAA